VKDVLGGQRQQRAHLVENRKVSARIIDELALFRRHLAPGERAIEERCAVCLDDLRRLLRGREVHGGVVDDQVPAIQIRFHGLDHLDQGFAVGHEDLDGVRVRRRFRPGNP